MFRGVPLSKSSLPRCGRKEIVMTKRFVTDDPINTFFLRQWELGRRVLDGTLDPEVINNELQKLIEGSAQPSPAPHPLVKASAKHFGVRLSSKLTRQLGPVPYSDAVLSECAETHVLVPYLGLSLAQVHQAHLGLFWSKDDNAWYRQAHHSYSSTKHQPRWYLVQKTVLLGSLGKTWSEQLQLVQESAVNEVVPAAVLVYAIVFHYLETGGRLLAGHYVRTNDVTEGDRVHVGVFDVFKLDVSAWDDYSSSDLGVAVSRKL